MTIEIPAGLAGLLRARADMEKTTPEVLATKMIETGLVLTEQELATAHRLAVAGQATYQADYDLYMAAKAGRVSIRTALQTISKRQPGEP